MWKSWPHPPVSHSLKHLKLLHEEYAHILNLIQVSELKQEAEARQPPGPAMRLRMLLVARSWCGGWTLPMPTRPRRLWRFSGPSTEVSDIRLMI